MQYLQRSGEIQRTFTLFASEELDKESKSPGILLIKLKPKEQQQQQTLQSTVTVSYEDREECDYSNSKSVIFDDKGMEEYFGSVAIRKSILLCRYTQLLIEWINDTQSLDDALIVNAKYKYMFGEFIKHFENEMVVCNDDSLKKELNVLQKLIK